jgi:hypothetical protein
LQAHRVNAVKAMKFGVELPRLIVIVCRRGPVFVLRQYVCSHIESARFSILFEYRVTVRPIYISEFNKLTKNRKATYTPIHDLQ